MLYFELFVIRWIIWFMLNYMLYVELYVICWLIHIIKGNNNVRIEWKVVLFRSINIEVDKIILAGCRLLLSREREYFLEILKRHVDDIILPWVADGVTMYWWVPMS